MHRRPRTTPIKRANAARGKFNRFWQIMFSFIIVAVIGTALLSVLIITGHANAAADRPLLTATPGDQQANLSWTTVTNATGYIIKQTNLSAGGTTPQALSPTVTGTTFSVTGLQTGQWYRFSVAPVGAGTESAPVDVRTTGLATYQHIYALGDSYTAGNGAPPFMGVPGCFQSAQSYPFQLAANLATPVTPVEFACSGAVTDNVDKTPQTVQNAPLPTTQLAQLQNSPLANSLITMTIGGNDQGVNFAPELEKCIFGIRSCAKDQPMIAQGITALKPRLIQLYGEIRQVAPGADILILGYPLLFADPATKACNNLIVQAGVSRAEMTAIRQLAGMLDQTIKDAAATAGVTPVTDQVINQFAGHEVCAPGGSGNEFINEIAGIFNGDMAKDSFHPKATGYQADATAVNQVLAQLAQTGMVRN